jgi:hypothetical protein
MMVLRSAAAILMMMAAVGVTGCNGHDDHDRRHVDERRDPPRDVRPCDHDHDPHCDDRPR